MTSLKEKQVERMLDKLFGDADPTLRIVSKLALTNTELTPEIIATIEYLKKQNEEEVKALNEELEMTLDASGNLVPITKFQPVYDCGGNLVHRLPIGKT